LVSSVNSRSEKEQKQGNTGKGMENETWLTRWGLPRVGKLTKKAKCETAKGGESIAWKESSTLLWGK